MTYEIKNELLIGDCRNILHTLPERSVQCVITSPPYYNLRDYGVENQIGQETDYKNYISNMVNVFCKIKRVLRDDGTLWLNLGDSYAGSGGCGDFKQKKLNKMTPLRKTLNSDLKPKDLIGIPWRIALALQADGWYLRQDIIWHKPNAIPEPVKDRCTNSHEYLFLLSKNRHYYFDYEAIKEPATTFEKRAYSVVRNRELKYKSKLNSIHGVGHEAAINAQEKVHRQDLLGIKSQSYDTAKRSKRSVWSVNTRPYTGAHFAAFPIELIIPCVLAGSKEGDIVLDPFFGSGTVAEAATMLNRSWIGIELNKDYAALYKQRLGLFNYGG